MSIFPCHFSGSIAFRSFALTWNRSASLSRLSHFSLCSLCIPKVNGRKPPLYEHVWKSDSADNKKAADSSSGLWNFRQRVPQHVCSNIHNNSQRIQLSSVFVLQFFSKETPKKSQKSVQTAQLDQHIGIKITCFAQTQSFLKGQQRVHLQRVKCQISIRNHRQILMREVKVENGRVPLSLFELKVNKMTNTD